MTLRTATALSVVVVITLTGCSTKRVPSGDAALSVTTTPSSDDETQATPSGESGCHREHHSVEQRPDEVLVFFACGVDPDDVVAFVRTVDPRADAADRLRAALRAYLAGPEPFEGHHLSFGSPKALKGAAVEGSRAIIDLDLAAMGLTSTTSTQSALLWAHLKAHAFQFPEIRTMEPRYNGSCRAFGMAVQAGECVIATRGGEYIPG